MRSLRILGLALIVTAAGLLSGGASGAAPATGQIVAAPELRPVLAPPAPAIRVEVPLLAPAPAVVPPAPAAVPVVKPPPKPKPKPTLVKGTPCRSNASACVDLSANRAWLISDGAVEYGPVPITHGRKGFGTPAGTFRVSYKAADHVSSIYDAEMPYSVFFNDGIAFHQGSLKVLSHGCVHLSGKAAKTFFSALGRGEIVQVVR